MERFYLCHEVRCPVCGERLVYLKIQKKHDPLLLKHPFRRLRSIREALLCRPISGRVGRMQAMIRRRPLLRTRVYPEVSQHYELILDGAVRRYSDGREVCIDSAAGWKEYKRRVAEMLQRQNFRCCLCGRRLSLANATFEHQRRRGAGSAFRDDAIERDGHPVNGAAHWICNSEKG